MKVTVHYTQEFMGEILNWEFDKHFTPKSSNMSMEFFEKMEIFEKMEFETEVMDALCDDPHVKRVWFEYHEEVEE